MRALSFGRELTGASRSVLGGGEGAKAQVDAAKSDKSVPIQRICIGVPGLASARGHFACQKCACVHEGWRGLHVLDRVAAGCSQILISARPV